MPGLLQHFDINHYEAIRGPKRRCKSQMRMPHRVRCDILLQWDNSLSKIRRAQKGVDHVRKNRLKTMELETKKMRRQDVIDSVIQRVKDISLNNCMRSDRNKKSKFPKPLLSHY